MVRGCCDGFNVFATDVIKTQISITNCRTLIDIATRSSLLCFSFRSFFTYNTVKVFFGVILQYFFTKLGPRQELVSSLLKVVLAYPIDTLFTLVRMFRVISLTLFVLLVERIALSFKILLFYVKSDNLKHVSC